MTTVDRLPRQFDAASNFLQLRDYRGALSATPGYVGTWRADDPSMIGQDSSGRLSMLRDWDDARRLVQTNADPGGTATPDRRPTRIYDLELGRYVVRADYVGRQFLQMTGPAVMDPTGGWMIAAIIRLESDVGGFQNIIGIGAGPPDTQNAAIQIRGTALGLAMNGVLAPQVDARPLIGCWTTVIASYDGNGNAALQVNSNDPLLYSGAVSEPVGVLPWKIGSEFFPWGGSVDCVIVANFPYHYSSNGAAKTTIRDYLTLRLA